MLLRVRFWAFHPAVVILVKKKTWRNWPEVYERQFYLKWCLFIAFRLSECEKSIHIPVYHYMHKQQMCICTGISLLTSMNMAGNPSSWKWRWGRRLISVWLGQHHLWPRASPGRSCPRGPATYFPVTHGGQPLPSVSRGLRGHRGSRPSQTPGKAPPVSSTLLCFSLHVSPIAWICRNCFASEIRNHLHKCFTLRCTKPHVLFFLFFCCTES